MTTPRFSFKLARVLPFIRNTLHRRRGVLFFYTALCLLFMPIQYALSIYQYRVRYDAAEWTTWYGAMNTSLCGPARIYNAFSAVFLTALLIIMPLVLSVSLYSYMHNRRSVDVYHALPLTRQELFLGTAIAAAVILWSPLVLSFALTAILTLFVPTASALAVLWELLFWMAGTLTIFATTSFVATQVGTSSDQAMFSIVFNASVSGACVMVNTLAGTYLYGYVDSQSFYELVYRLCPASLMIGRMAATDGSFLSGNSAAAVIWFVVAILLLMVSSILYGCRRSEQAEVLGNMGPLQMYVRAVGTLIAGICFGWILYAVFDPNGGAGMLACIGAGSLLAYYIGDVILTHSIRRLRVTLPAALATVAVVCVICGGVIFDYFGFEKRVPAVDQVESVTLTSRSFRYSEQSGYKTGNYNKVTLDDPATLEAVVAAHTAQAGAEENSEEYANFDVTYQLTNGKIMRRSYYRVSAETKTILSALETNGELLTETAAVFRMEPADLREVRVQNAFGTSDEVVALSENQKAALLEALCADLLNQPQSELEEGAEPAGTLWLTVPYNEGRYVEEDSSTTYVYQLTPSFTRTLSLLRQTPQASALENDLQKVDSVKLWLYGSWANDSTNYLVAGGNEVPSTEWEYREKGLQKLYPTCELTGAEYASLNGLTCYIPNSAASRGELVAVLYFAEGQQNPGGWCFIRLSDLPQTLRTRVIAAYENYYEEPYAPNSTNPLYKPSVAYTAF